MGNSPGFFEALGASKTPASCPSILAPMDMPFYEKEKLDRSFPFLAWDRIQPNFWFPLHWHAQVELLSILRGRLDVIIKGKTWEGREGDIVMVDTGLIHGFSNPDPGTGVRIYQFGLEIFSGTLPEVHAEEQSPIFSRKPLITSAQDGPLHTRLEGLLSGLFTEYRQQESGYRLAVISRLYELAVILLRDIPREDSAMRTGVRRKNQHDRLDRVFAFIAGNFDNPDLSLEMAAETACLSKCYFSRFLKEHTGQSFYEYLSRTRLYRAEQYLVETDIPVIDIAYCCGFNSLTTFNRLFKTYTGTTPSAYRSGKPAVPLPSAGLRNLRTLPR